MELQFAELLSLILTGVVLVQSAMIHRSVPRESWDKYLEQSEQAAKKTESQIDDKIAQVQRNWLTPFMEKFGMFGNSEHATESKPLIDPAIKARIEAPIEG